MHALEVSQLSAGYGKTTVLHDVSLHVDRGSIVGLLGRNGAGKSTTLRSIAGLTQQRSGEIRVDGKLLTGSAYARSASGAVGLVLEGRSVLPSLTTQQNLRVAQVDADVAVDMFPELGPKLSLRAGLLSGGEQQMLSLARAVGRKPSVLLIDELSFGLAPLVCERLFAALPVICEFSGTAILLVEQHLRFAASVCSYAYVLDDGRVALEVRGEDLLDRAVEIEDIYVGTRLTKSD